MSAVATGKRGEQADSGLLRNCTLRPALRLVQMICSVNPFGAKYKPFPRIIRIGTPIFVFPHEVRGVQVHLELLVPSHGGEQPNEHSM